MLFDQAFEEKYTYSKGDLGALYQKEQTVFRMWAPTAEAVFVNLFKDGERGEAMASYPMINGEAGTWYYTCEGDYDGIYYTYSITVNNQTREAVDLYAKAVGVNGKRAMVIDLNRTNPEGFSTEQRPRCNHATESVIYELHIRDFSSQGPFVHPGKYLAFTEFGLKDEHGLSLGLDYLKELGVTHVHLLPTFDYGWLDETNQGNEQYNWGYDPVNYNVPEGSYSTNPYDGAVRIREFKQMVKALHEQGIQVVMDVVYNHTYETLDSNFQKTVPDYYYRKQGEVFSDASACGNEVASERSMVRKYIIDSLEYWVKEYHIDGFRFDLMGVHDIETMQEIRTRMDAIDPGILLYGEGWTGNPSVLPEEKRAMKAHMSQMPGIGAFCDDMRDALKGSVFVAKERGFATGAKQLTESVKFGIVAATQHPQIDYSNINYSNSAWAKQPNQCINYASAHDNLTLWDKLSITNAEETREVKIKRNLLIAAILFTSQGIPFFMAGEEMLRTKPNLLEPGSFDENSYRSPDETNQLRWDRRSEMLMVTNYYKGLIEFRKAHIGLRLTTTEQIQSKLTFLETNQEQVIAYQIQEDEHTKVCVVHNASMEEVRVELGFSNWTVYVEGTKAGVKPLRKLPDTYVIVPGISSCVLVHKREEQS